MPFSFSKAIKASPRHSLSFRLLSYILACSTLFAVLITLVQLFWDYRQDRNMVESSLNQIEASFLQPIASSLWNLDEEQIQVQLEGIMNLPSMQFVEVKEAMGENQVRLQSMGKELPSYDISREFDLIQAAFHHAAILAVVPEQLQHGDDDGQQGATSQDVGEQPKGKAVSG